mmetsp:Transcript_40211/g.129153  ORF Transcript_40211/g.129153 Transcript_40211/m.129153 type:complete len:356 (-) Transcript_40211:294-1361(-)
MEAARHCATQNAGLAPELVTASLFFLNLSDLVHAAHACRGWSAAGKREDLWWVMVGRQLSTASPPGLGLSADCGGLASALGEALGPCREAAEGGRPGQIARLLAEATSARSTPLAAWQPAPSQVQQVALSEMSGPAQRFLFGLAHGSIPCRDGAFTYHCLGATPIHYRHELDDLVGEALEEWMEPQSVRLAGTWSWSPDRENWFPTSTLAISRGRFGGGGWQLVADNKVLVGFLEAWPLLPLFRAPLRLPFGLSARPSAASSEELLADFRRAVLPAEVTDRPSTPCIKLNAFAVHPLLLPAIHLCADERGWSVSELSRRGDYPVGTSPPEIGALLQTLDADRAGPFPLDDDDDGL